MTREAIPGVAEVLASQRPISQWTRPQETERLKVRFGLQAEVSLFVRAGSALTLNVDRKHYKHTP
jgi:hypothetical protein